MLESNLNPVRSKGPKTYMFEFISDREKFTTTFKGVLSEENIHDLLKTLQAHLYNESSEVIGKYLRSHPLEYSDFHARTTTMEHHEIMAHAAGLLSYTTVSWIDSVTGTADNYYSIIDHQEWIQEDVCEGCYFAVKKTPPRQGSTGLYNIIGQTFKENRKDIDTQGFFDIRTNDGSAKLNSIQQVNVTVIPSYGCVDMIALLSEIDNVKTCEQVIQLAVR